VSLACLNTWGKVALWCPRPWRGLHNSAVSSMECPKHQGNLSLNSCCLAPTLEERPITAGPYRPQGVSKHQALGGSEASRGVTPSMVFPSHGYRGVTLLMTCLASGDFVPSTVFPTRGYRGDAICALYWQRHQHLILATLFYWRRLILAMPPSGDALSWPCPILATPGVIDLLTWP